MKFPSSLQVNRFGHDDARFENQLSVEAYASQYWTTKVFESIVIASESLNCTVDPTVHPRTTHKPTVEAYCLLRNYTQALQPKKLSTHKPYSPNLLWKTLYYLLHTRSTVHTYCGSLCTLFKLIQLKYYTLVAHIAAVQVKPPPFGVVYQSNCGHTPEGAPEAIAKFLDRP